MCSCVHLKVSQQLTLLLGSCSWAAFLLIPFRLVKYSLTEVCRLQLFFNDFGMLALKICHLAERASGGFIAGLQLQAGCLKNNICAQWARRRVNNEIVSGSTLWK